MNQVFIKNYCTYGFNTRKKFSMGWISLLFAGFFEVVWAVGLKYSAGFTKLIPSIITVIGMLLSILLLSSALRTIPLGTAYAAWTGIGTVGAIIFGVICFGEPIGAMKTISFLFIILGIVGLKLLT